MADNLKPQLDELPTRSTPIDGTWQACPTCQGDGHFVTFDGHCPAAWAHRFLNAALPPAPPREGVTAEDIAYVREQACVGYSACDYPLADNLRFERFGRILAALERAPRPWETDEAVKARARTPAPPREGVTAEDEEETCPVMSACGYCPSNGCVRPRVMARRFAALTRGVTP